MLFERYMREEKVQPARTALLAVLDRFSNEK